VRGVSRADEAIVVTTLGELDPALVDMFTLVLGRQQPQLCRRRADGDAARLWREDRETGRQGDKQ